LARAVISAATDAGASFADVRLGEQRVYVPSRSNVFGGELRLTSGYGLRVRVNGCDAFIAGADLALPGLIQAAQQAVAVARALATVATPARPLVPVPVVTGEWDAPIAIDPFGVSPDDHAFVTAGFTTWGRPSGRIIADFRWLAETRVFASSEGSLLTQRSTRVMPKVSVSGGGNWHYAAAHVGGDLALPEFAPATAGFEAILGAARHEALERATDEMRSLAAHPLGLAEVGRKPVVLDGQASATLILETLGSALSLGRVLGDAQNSEGTSLLTPMAEVLGQPLFSPALNLAVAHGMPHFYAASWDDEGVATTTFPAITQGAVVNYLSSRATGHALTASGNYRGSLLPAPGVGLAPNVMAAPRGMAGTLVMPSATNGPTLDELARTLSNGLLVRNAWVRADVQGAGGTLFPKMLFEVRRGQIVRRLVSARLQFSTRKLLKGIVAVGGASTVAPASLETTDGVPPSPQMQMATAPAMHLHDINVVTNQ
jgi:TldD protein